MPRINQLNEMTKIRVTSVKAFRMTKEKAKEVEIIKHINNHLFTLEASDLMEKEEIEAYRATFKSEPDITILLAYEEI